MNFFSDWDDLVHGTLVFGALVPLGVALAVGWFQTTRPGWAVALSLAAPLLWFFGLPGLQFGSEDAAVWAFVVSLAFVGLDLLPGPRFPRSIVGAVMWAVLAWMLYPTWLAAGGGIDRRLLVSGALAASITLFGLACARLTSPRPDGVSPPKLTLAAFLPLAVSLSILLILGGATRFSQSAGAIASCLGGLCLVHLAKPVAGIRQSALLSMMLLGFLAWAGWLFAEIRPLAAALIFVTPLAALAARRLPFPRTNSFLVMLWDGLAAGLAAACIIGVVAFREIPLTGSDNEGYSRLPHSVPQTSLTAFKDPNAIRQHRPAARLENRADFHPVEGRSIPGGKFLD